MPDASDVHDDRGLDDARARVEALFAKLNTLTPDELGRIGLLRPPEERKALIAAVDAAARATGRQELVAGARRQAGDIVMRRYADGTYRPTWIALNWGLSGGTVEDRVAVVEAVADAAAVAAVSDALDPEIASALAADAEHVIALAGGSASDGALVRALRQPGDPTLGRTPRRQRLFLTGAAVAVAVAVIGGMLLDFSIDLNGWLALLIVVPVVYWLLARTSGRA